ncbi:hypothetical protein DYST_02871 [Dyella terrae]|nr:hypothetical protein DYST_02871 [Dyella terrae]
MRLLLGGDMQDKLLTVVVYLAIGAYIVFLLAKNLWGGDATSKPLRFRWYAVAGIVAVSIFIVFSSPSSSWLAVALAGVSALACTVNPAGRERRVDWASAGVLAAVFCVAASLAWWRRTGPVIDISWREQLIVSLLLVVGTRWFLRKGDGEDGGRLAWSLVLAVMALAAIVSLFSTGLYENAWMRWLSWHHWGAYIGPAQLALLGVPVLHDIPVQYGVGPTALVALACGRNCWHGMYFLAGGLNLLYCVLLALAGFCIAGVRRVSGQMVLIALSVLLSVIVWTAYPANLGSPMLTPSVVGLRFLPLALLVFALVRRMDAPQGTVPAPVLHVLWLLGVLWSPESAFQTTLVWWPFHVWMSTCTGGADGSRLRRFLLANVRLCAWLAAGVLIFLLAYWSIYGVLPRLDVYLAYVEHPPGVIPVKPFGAVWFF